MPTNYQTRDKPYCVFMEEHWDYYKDPPVRPKLGEFDSYMVAVEFACSIIEEYTGESVSNPTSFWISPEPPGLHFDSHAYENFLNNSLTNSL